MCARSDGPGGGSSPTADREITSTRVFDAPRELVFKMWTERHHMEQWWGPNGFTTTTHQIEVKPGGVWRFIMHGPDGRDYHNLVVFTEVVKPERLVYRHAGEKGTEDVKFHVTVNFEPQGRKTLLTMRLVFATAAEREEVVTKYGALEGGQQTLARLAAHVENQ